jgi:hypothetical protein
MEESGMRQDGSSENRGVLTSATGLIGAKTAALAVTSS